MSRTLKRVPLSFDWPIGKTWSGYVNPYADMAGECPDCVSGYDRAGGRPDANATLFRAQWYGEVPFDWYAYGARSAPLTQDHPAYLSAVKNVDNAPEFYAAMHGIPRVSRLALVGAEARRLHALWRQKWAHHLIQADVDALIADGRLRKGTTPAEVNVLDVFDLGGWGDVCIRARCERERVPFQCARCDGSAILWPSPDVEEKCESWEDVEPPTGDGYQLWQTCSEGSPISPVFDSLDALCAWAAVHATTFADCRATAEEWRAMLEEDFVHAADARGNIWI